MKDLDVRVDIMKDENFVKNLLKDHDEKVASIAVACLKLDPVERPTAEEIIKFIDVMKIYFKLIIIRIKMQNQ